MNNEQVTDLHKVTVKYKKGTRGVLARDRLVYLDGKQIKYATDVNLAFSLDGISKATITLLAEIEVIEVDEIEGIEGKSEE